MRADLEQIVWTAACHPKIRSWKIVLLNLCYHANAAGETYPSATKVAQETGYSLKAVVEAIAGLERLGIVEKKGACGMRNRVSVYSLSGLSTNVHKLANGEVSSCLQDFNSELSSKKSGFNSELSSPNSELSSSRNILGNNKVSKLVSSGANSELTSTFVDKSKNEPKKRQDEVAPSALYDGASSTSGKPDYKTLVKSIKWKPATQQDRMYCMYHCYTLGADRNQAETFIRYNAIRKWDCCEFGTVNDAAKQWVAKWRKTNPREFWAERARRRKADVSGERPDERLEK